VKDLISLEVEPLDDFRLCPAVGRLSAGSLLDLVNEDLPQLAVGGMTRAV